MLKTFALVLALSDTSGFSSPSPGAELSVGFRSFTAEISLFDVEKRDGGEGYSTTARVSFPLGQRWSVGPGLSCIDVDQFQRCDPSFSIEYRKALRLEAYFPEDGGAYQRLEVHPQWTLGSGPWFISTRAAWTQGRGSQGLSGAIVGGVQW